MPKPKAQPKPPVAKPKANGKKPPADRKVWYPDIAVNGVVIPRDKLKITVAMAKQILGWETEAEYKERVGAEGFTPDDPDAKFGGACFFDHLPSGSKTVKKLRKSFGDDFLFKDATGAKVVCWRDLNNREFDRRHAMGLAQDVLTKNWRLNLETVIISLYGQVISGQHRLAALVFAAQIWDGPQADHWKEFWEEEPWIECLVACGGSEDPEVIRTTDNVKPRSLADVFFTSPLFAGHSRSVRGQLSDILSRATEFLWKRTGAGSGVQGQFVSHCTKAESVEFLQRHKRLLDAVTFIHSIENPSVKDSAEVNTRGLQDLRLSWGQCAAALYLMATCDSSPDEYTNPDNLPANESTLDFGWWEQAEKFFLELSKAPGKGRAMQPVRDALASLVTEDGAEASSVEKMIVLAKAWAAWRADQPLDAEELRPVRTVPTPEKPVPELNEWPGFGGIDQGPARRKERAGSADGNVNGETVAKDKRAAKEKALLATLDAKNGDGTPAPTLKDQLAELRAAHPGKVLLHRAKGGTTYTAYGQDAGTVAKAGKLKLEKHPDEIDRTRFELDAFERVRDALLAAGHTAAIVTEDAGAFEVVPVVKPLAKPIGKKASDAPVTHNKDGKPLATKVLPQPLNRRPGTVAAGKRSWAEQQKENAAGKKPKGSNEEE